MNTRNAYALRAARAAANRATRPGSARPGGAAGSPPASVAARPPFAGATDTVTVLTPPGPHDLGPNATGTAGGPSRVLPADRHPLADLAANARLAHCEETVNGRFAAILPVLKTLSSLARDDDFPRKAQAIAEERLGYRLPAAPLEASWLVGLDLQKLYAHCVFAALNAAVAQFAEDLRQHVESVQDTRNFFLDCGFHAVDISPCSDGRLKGLSRYILRLPLTSFARRTAHAGALFDVEDDVHHWESIELRRYREGVPTTTDAGTRYLKVAVYHLSSSDPTHLGCAAHGSSDQRATEAALARLNEFRESIENAFCCGASTDLLLIGVDTDNDSIRVHIPDAEGDLSIHRFVDNAALHAATAGMHADQACLAIYEAIRVAGQTTPWGQGHGEPHDGMRRLIANLLINNLSQIDYVNELHDGRYADLGHAERYISVGDGFEEVQMRNIAYYAHLHTLEEGHADMDVGIKIFTGLNLRHGLPIPIAVHYRYDARVPGARERAAARALRVHAAIRARYAELDAQGQLVFQLSVQDRPAGSALELLEGGLS